MIKFTQITILFMVGALLQGLGSVVHSAQQSINYSKALAVQKEENEKIRQYNFLLAKAQNEWNLQQWERSNEYNNPLNQMNRLKAAGLNPNLVYGNGAGQSLAAPNPQLTSGSPSTPQDMSLLAQRPTVGQVITQTLQNRALLAQIENTEAKTEKEKADTGLTKIELRTKEALEKLVGDPQLILNDKDVMRNPLVQKELSDLVSLQNSIKLQSYDLYHKSADKVIRELNFDLEKKISSEQWNALSKQLGKSVQECKEYIEQTALRLRGITADVENKEAAAFWDSPEMMQKLPEGLPMLVKFLRIVLGN